DRRILARIHRATIAHLRREIEPVPASTFLRFLFSWQHLAGGTQLSGDHGLLEVVEQLEGFEAAAAAWEDEILRPRIRDYEPASRTDRPGGAGSPGARAKAAGPCSIRSVLLRKILSSCGRGNFSGAMGWLSRSFLRGNRPPLPGASCSRSCAAPRRAARFAAGALFPDSRGSSLRCRRRSMRFAP